jgi:hypothetical protein
MRGARQQSRALEEPMETLTGDEEEFWEKAFLAAITGLGAQYNENAIADEAETVADNALKIARERMSRFQD